MVAALARRIVQTLCQPCSIEGRQINLGVSIGVALAQQHGHGLDELIGNADLALYAAKDAGRARFEVFSPRLGDRRRRKIAVEQALRGAAGRGEFELAWQPRVEIDGWQLTGAEALARWRHPELGVVSPVEFIASAEESGAILEIGAWVLEQACLDAARLDSPLVVSVNASPVQLMKPDFLALTRAALERSGLAPQRLEIEVTESLFLGACRGRGGAGPAGGAARGAVRRRAGLPGGAADAAGRSSARAGQLADRGTAWQPDDALARRLKHS
ncbi:MAG: EAL domain-containing protein [Burkholderiales bacterium]|nr:EAL domain-containing protein [Burkholderiales bacterium]